MLTNIENNIKMHFENRFKRTIFEFCFNKQKEGLTSEEYKFLPKIQKKKLRDLAKFDSKAVQSDILNLVLPLPDDSSVNPDNVILLSHPIYHNWIYSVGVTFVTPHNFPEKVKKEPKKKIIEKKETKKTNIAKDKPKKRKPLNYYVKSNPLNYLPCMIRMNLFLESIGAKQFKAFPLQSNIVPKHIEIDSDALEAIFLTAKEQKTFVSDEIQENYNFSQMSMKDRKYKVWNHFFNLNDRMFKSGPLIPNPINPTEIIPSYVFDYAIKTDGISISTRFVQSVNDNPQRVTGKQRFAKKSSDEDEEKKVTEFPYFEDLNDEQFELLRKSHRVYIDPGK